MNKLETFLKKYNIPESQKIEGSLDLSSLTSIPEGFNPTVGGSLDLRSLTSIPEGFNPTVGGWLDLSIKHNVKTHDFTQGEKGKGWIYADGRLTHITGVQKTIGEFTFYQGKIPNMNLITDGKNWVHCDTLRNGIIDLRFKAVDRDKSDYEDLTLDSVISHEDAVVMYRVITGACQQGTQAFLNSMTEQKDEYTVREIIELTDGQYNNNLLKKFFGVG